MKPSDPAVDADACMATIIGHANICMCIRLSVCGRFIITGSAVRCLASSVRRVVDCLFDRLSSGQYVWPVEDGVR